MGGNHNRQKSDCMVSTQDLSMQFESDTQHSSISSLDDDNKNDTVTKKCMEDTKVVHQLI